MVELNLKLTVRINTSSQPKENALTLSKNTEDTWLFAIGARELQLQKSDGDGFQLKVSGTDGMMANGTTGAHQREDSPHLDGPGIKATGIMAAMSSNTTEADGGDSKAKNGLTIRKKYQ